MREAMSPIENSGSLSAVAARVQEFTTEASAERRQEFEKILLYALPRFRSIAARWLGNHEDAEDAVQDAMLCAFKHIASFNGRAKMSTWLTAIVINAVRMQIRRRPRARMLSFDYSSKEGRPTISERLMDPCPTPEKTVEQFELYELAIKLTRGLAPSQRTALRVHQQHDFSIRKAATNLGIPEGTLKAQLARGRAKLAERFHKTLAKPETYSSKSDSKRHRRSACRYAPDRNQISQLPVAVIAK
ncbi:MAG TPA: sigma-70 family RNA polymerase sigma factor [Terriglobales bacterium]|nr:sigma-70 family RNA polymerase sigma factor [Terriglobales bacterium]